MLTVQPVLAVGACEQVRALAVVAAVVAVAALVARAAVLAGAGATRLVLVVVGSVRRVGDVVRAGLRALARGAREAGQADAHHVAVAAGHALAAVLARVRVARI